MDSVGPLNYLLQCSAIPNASICGTYRPQQRVYLLWGIPIATRIHLKGTMNSPVNSNRVDSFYVDSTGFLLLSGKQDRKDREWYFSGHAWLEGPHWLLEESTEALEWSQKKASKECKPVRNNNSGKDLLRRIIYEHLSNSILRKYLKLSSSAPAHLVISFPTIFFRLGLWECTWI